MIQIDTKIDIDRPEQRASDPLPAPNSRSDATFDAARYMPSAPEKTPTTPIIRETPDLPKHDEIRVELLKALYRRFDDPAPLAVVAVLALAYMASDWVPWPTLAGWTTVILVILSLWFIFARRFRTGNWRKADVGRWHLTFLTLTLATGIAWGGGLVMMFDPQKPLVFIGLCILLAGLCAHALSSFSQSMPLFLAFTLPVYGLYSARLVATGDTVHLFTAIALTLLMATLWSIATGLHRSFSERVSLQLQNSKLARELKVAWRETEEKSQAKSRFLANMSHELRTPLNAIIGFSDVMRNNVFGELGSSKYDTYIEDIHRSGEHLLHLIAEILDVAKIESGENKLTESVVDSRQLFVDCLKLTHQRAVEREIDLSLDMPGWLPQLRIDKTKFCQIILNLVLNAVKFTPSFGSVDLRARVDRAGQLIVEVEDTGIGMEQSEITQALMPFVQLEHVSPHGDQGAGLGLPLVKSLVELHQGTLSIKSVLGKGTTATVVLPKERVILATQPAD